MQRRMTFRLYLLSTVFIVFLTNVRAQNADSLDSKSKIEEVYKYNSNIKISVDPRIEFITIVSSMTRWGKTIDKMLNYNNSYKDYTYYHEIEKKFYPFRNHPAILFADSLDFHWDAMPEYILFHDNPPQLEQLRQYDTEMIRRARSLDNLNKLTRELRDFAFVTKFNEFYLSHIDFYKSLVSDVAHKFQPDKSIQTLENFFGWKLKNYSVIIAPCMHPMGGFGCRIPEDNNYHGIYIKRVEGTKDNKPYFGDANSIYELALHEFGHSFVNPTTDKFKNEINALKPIYKDIEAVLKQNVTYDWFIKFDEQLLESFTAYITQIEGDSLKAEKSIKNCETIQGLYLTRQIAELFHYYSKNRDKYPTFDTFYPMIIKSYYDNVDVIRKKYKI